MIVIDTSALFAILNAENEASIYADCIFRANQCAISSATRVELGTICLNRLTSGLVRMEQLLEAFSITTKDLDVEQADLAIRAYGRFGKGRGNKAGLNLGDCFSYALAKSLDVPLLFKGDDFTHTDIRSALAP